MQNLETDAGLRESLPFLDYIDGPPVSADDSSSVSIRGLCSLQG